MLNILLVRPGATSFDDEGRIKGSLDMPLSESGLEQARQTAEAVADVDLEVVYSAPCESAMKTSKQVIADREIKLKSIDGFRNIDHGLWHGKLLDDVRRQHPRVYRLASEDASSVCPPGGEAFEDARVRVGKSLRKIIKKHRNGSIALVIPDPLASVVYNLLSGEQLGSLWMSEVDTGGWQKIELPSENPKEAILA